MRYLSMCLSFAVLCILAASSAAEQKNTYQAIVNDDGIQRVDVLAGGYFFNPVHIIVKANKVVELRVKKEYGIIPHNFVIKAPEAGIDIDESLRSEQKIIRFTPAKTGKYEFYCSQKFLFFKSHREKGMEGILEVTE